ncbi:hypothetical protein PENTCL1PPCAC_16732 [Pristionchus entomophagus]|uniref:Sushi domain-containing protein n=1 Tax=Pristionchus entomophagus TaxID=358040 RepID=A0AAV5TJH2_9BILA|nr:hypothetical protein PENTCL1PPCAC_16732 [Pristionchus entomophagus]
MNLISCKQNSWIASSTSNMSTVPVQSALGWISTSCIPSPTMTTCDASKYTTFDCDGCDKTKIVPLPSTKGRCVLACDKGYRLVALDESHAVIRAQEAVLQQQWKAIMVDSSSAKFSCEPATTIVVPPKATPPVCGCTYSLKECANCDNSQLIGRHDGSGTCTISCSPGYQLVSEGSVDGGALTAVTCHAYRWKGRSASLSNPFASFSPTLSCVRTESAKCLSTYSPLSSCTTCDGTKLRPLSTWKQCQLGCATGFRLVVNSANFLTSKQRYTEITAADNKWSGLLLDGTLSSLTALFVNCEPDVPTKSLANCGCPYKNQGAFPSKLVSRTVWTNGGNCELICEPGYYLQISCEPDTYPEPPSPFIKGGPAKPCEYCKQPKDEPNCPPGKSCVRGSLPLWKTTAGCMQARCKSQRAMQINRNGAWITADGLNCEANGSWTTTSGVALTADVAVTCDAKTGGNDTLIEVIYNIYRKGNTLEALRLN